MYSSKPVAKYVMFVWFVLSSSMMLMMKGVLRPEGSDRQVMVKLSGLLVVSLYLHSNVASVVLILVMMGSIGESGGPVNNQK